MTPNELTLCNAPVLMGERLKCGCTIQYLAQGCAVFPCKEHQPKVLEAMRNSHDALR